MVNNQPQKTIDSLIGNIKNLSDSELQKIKFMTTGEEAARNREKQKENLKKIIIKDFNDAKVKPFSASAVYDVYNTKTHTELVMNGETVSGKIISAGDDKHKAFVSKKIGFL